MVFSRASCPRLHYNDERRDLNSTNCPKNFKLLCLSGGVALLAYLGGPNGKQIVRSNTS